MRGSHAGRTGAGDRLTALLAASLVMVTRTSVGCSGETNRHRRRAHGLACAGFVVETKSGVDPGLTASVDHWVVLSWLWSDLMCMGRAVLGSMMVPVRLDAIAGSLGG